MMKNHKKFNSKFNKYNSNENRHIALTKILSELGNKENISACLIIDENGLLVSEFINDSINKDILTVFSSSLNINLNKFKGNLNLADINFLMLNTKNGIIFLKEIPLKKHKRRFLLSIFFKKSNNNFEKSNIKSLKIHYRFLEYLYKLFRLEYIFKDHYFNGTYLNNKILKEIENVIFKIQFIFNQ